MISEGPAPDLIRGRFGPRPEPALHLDHREDPGFSENIMPESEMMLEKPRLALGVEGTGGDPPVPFA